MDKDDSGAKARVDQSAINYSQAATTTYAGSTIQSGQTEDKQSVYSYNTMEAQNFVRRIGNRAYNAMSDVYFLPTDDDEWTRLNKQHIAIFVGLGALYPVPDVVRSILAPKEGEVKRILDLGCGTGLWATEMAKEFPHCEVLGVDLAPVPIDKMDVPANCRFELDDITKGLGHFKGQYDFVNARLIGAGLKNFRQTLRDAAECLKPGGMVFWLDGDYDMYAEDQHVYMPFATDEDASGSWFQRIVYGS
ncbi:hypothetical protein M408DRAFT_83532 [Serendipita vermifera MAFF 305830]|uniref:Methyltransferase domain-containing protein n=1 Tax=Serendipita vermifera MAFF 305830 TaxID=933852 RepID=A0A0C3AH73_SERVB|nr:hypothetical protein M408DRAFT_83532 [Serendipita vermifera MAFF 305830]